MNKSKSVSTQRVVSPIRDGLTGDMKDVNFGSSHWSWALPEPNPTTAPEVLLGSDTLGGCRMVL